MERKDNGDYKLNENKLKYLASIGANFLDNVIDLNNYPLPQIESMTLKLRPIGLGVMGLHDAMLKAKIEYGSDESIHFINDVYKLIKAITVTASQDLGSVRGIPEDLDVFCIGRRNGYLLTCPPTGTISIISGCSSGIEPVFQFEYTRKDSFGEHKVKHFILDEFDINNLPEYAKTALQIPPEDHVKVQAAIQKHLDESVSKTVNLPESATKEDVEKIFMLAYDLGCKSITTYRSGSRQEEVLVKKEEHTVEEHKKENLDKVKVDKKEYLRKRGRPRVLWGCTIRINTPQGRCFITINEDKFGIREVLLHIAKAGSDIVAHTEAEGRLISSALKNGTNVEELIRQLEGQRSSSVAFDNGRPVKSIPDAVAKALQEYVDCYEGFSQYIDDPIEKKEKVDKEKREEEVKVSGDICPECGEALLLKEGGCATCKNCGYSRC
jgi:ribonucleoside-diphosphate reductase alpha chain